MSMKCLSASLLLAMLSLAVFCPPAAADGRTIEVSQRVGAQDRWAVIGKSGEVLRSSGIVSAMRDASFDLPIYTVTFDRDVTTCGYIATVTTPGMAAVKQSLTDTHAVVVYTRGTDGKRADRGFSLYVTCAPSLPMPAANPWAVVSAEGAFVRGSGFYSVTRKSAGRYTVTFDRPVDACVYSATVGLPGSTGSEAKGVISVSPFGENALYVYTLSETNKFGDRGFHLWVACDLPSSDRSASGSDFLVNGKGAKSIEHIDEGRYVVKFNRDVSGCAFVAATGLIGGPGGIDAGFIPPGNIAVARLKDHPKEISVRTHYGVAPLDRPFHVIAACD